MPGRTTIELDYLGINTICRSQHPTAFWNRDNCSRIDQFGGNIPTINNWARVKSVFGQALSIPAAKRRAWLDQITGISSLTRAEVHHLFKQEENGEAFEPSSAIECALEDANPQLSPHEVLADRFEVLRFVGRGGMGEVYAVFDRVTAQRVAIKLVNGDLTRRPESLRQVRREIQSARRVRHPNVCDVFDIHQDERPDGRELVFLSMRLLEGQNLHERIRDHGPLSLEDAKRLCEDLAAGVDAIHASGIVHRDLKSGNVMLVDNNSRAVILDFGLSHDRKITDSLSMFGSQAMVGTPAFMAPEQLEGKAVRPAADIYALGGVLFHALTGVLPFHGKTSLAVALRKFS